MKKFVFNIHKLVFNIRYVFLSKKYKYYWVAVDELLDAWDCGNIKCDAMVKHPYNYCPKCGEKKYGVRLPDKIITLKKYNNK